METFLIALSILLISLIGFFIYRAITKSGDKNSGTGKIDFPETKETSRPFQPIKNTVTPKPVSDLNTQAARSTESFQPAEQQKSPQATDEGKELIGFITKDGFNWKDFDASLPNFNLNPISQKTAAELKAQVEKLAAAAFTWEELERLLTLPNNEKAKDIVQRLISKYKFYQAEHGKTLIINILKRCCDNVIRSDPKATWFDGLEAAIVEADR